MAAPTPDHIDRSAAARTVPSLSGKVRVVAKIRNSTDSEVLPGKKAPASWISVNKPNGDASDRVKVTLGEQSASSRECYEIGYCYQENEGNEEMFRREVQFLLPEVFNGRSVTVVACGARGSGKTHVIQGTEGDLGLAALSMAEILRMSEESNKFVGVSCYEILQEHAYDLLEPKSQEVSVLKDGQGRVQLKGLSCVQVKSLYEFHKLYRRQSRTVRKANQKITHSFPPRSTKGLIFYISSQADKLASAPVGKINFVELAGYEDAKRKSDVGNFGENAQINKSIHAFIKVAYSLHANEIHVPYRESKLSRMLEDSLGGKSSILILTCLNPFSCQDSMNMLKLASRCSQSNTITTKIVVDSARKTDSTARSKVFASHRSRLPGSASSMRKQPTPSHFPIHGKKSSGNASALKARKLFADKGHEKPNKVNASATVSRTESSLPEEASSFIGLNTGISAQEEEASSLELENTPASLENALASLEVRVSMELTEENKHVDMITPATTALPVVAEVGQSLDKHVDMITPTTTTLSVVDEGQSLDKENDISLANKNESPPISLRLQEISNNLKQLYNSTPKQLYTSTPLRTVMPSSNDLPLQDQFTTASVEPMTPECNIKVNKNLDIASFCSPWEKLNRSNCGVKNSLVQEYLNFFNTANKEDLKKLKGIGEKRATYIMEFRDESPFMDLDELKDVVGLSAKQIKDMVSKDVLGGLFH
ncbi:unnamed protein product [Linum tenue]|uniref:Kinesin motor domain-containing protein n=1 Tax=Linum tenue TaxID=586396 RepID=A0AAV0J2M7_9ROSI|nr:unnamed protein product [Linum tenue]